MQRRWLVIGGALLLVGFGLGWLVRGAWTDSKATPRWALAKLRSADPVQRSEATWALAAHPFPEAADQLAQLLLDKEDHIRLVAAVALSRMGEPAIAPVLQVVRNIAEQSARNPQQPFHFLPGQFFRQPREAAVFILTHIARSSDGAKTVAKLLESDNPTEVGVAQEALRNVGAAALPTVLPYLNSDRREVRFAALSVIGACGEAGIDPLRKFLLEGKRESQTLLDQETRQMAIYALGSTRSDKALPVLKEALKDPQLQTAAWQAIGNLRTDGAKKFLLEQAKQFIKEKRDPPPTMVTAMGAMQLPEIKPYLFRWLQSSNQRVQEAAALALGMLREREAVPQLMALVLSKDVGVAAAAASALGSIADERALPALYKALERVEKPAEFQIVISALGAIQSINERAALPAVEAFLKKPNLPSVISEQAKSVAEYLRQYGR